MKVIISRKHAICDDSELVHGLVKHLPRNNILDYYSEYSEKHMYEILGHEDTMLFVNNDDYVSYSNPIEECVSDYSLTPKGTSICLIQDQI